MENKQENINKQIPIIANNGTVIKKNIIKAIFGFLFGRIIMPLFSIRNWIKIIRNLFSITFWKNFIKKTISIIKTTAKRTYLVFTFLALILLFFTAKIAKFVVSLPLLKSAFSKIDYKNGKLVRFHNLLIAKLEGMRPFEVKSSYLIYLAYENLKIKKSRTFITILGMSVGVGVIVLLLSLGYGVEKLVISKVATLDELKMIDVSTGGNTSLLLDKKAVNKIASIKGVSETIPIISTVGKMGYHNASLDVLVFSAPKNYFNIGKIKLKRGSEFAVETPSLIINDVAGAETSVKEGIYGEKTEKGNVKFNILPNKQVVAWNNCSKSSDMLGYVLRLEGGYDGEEYWSEDYYPGEYGEDGYDNKGNRFLGRWIKTKAPIYKEGLDSFLPDLDDYGRQKWLDVCLREVDMTVSSGYTFSQVLGISTSSANIEPATDSASVLSDSAVVSTDSSGMEFISYAGLGKKKETETVKFSGEPSGTVLASSGLLSMMGISENKALNTNFNLSYILSKNLIPTLNSKATTSDIKYKIIGVIDDMEEQYLYVPFSDMEKLKVSSYSQIKVVLKTKDEMVKVRKDIEAMGFRTVSTVDTIAQIESLFAGLRIVLFVLGLVALGVASLGMFNTLTVSLLERTREVGGMKAMGMVSDEVQELFLAEAMIIGFSGGVGGLVLGFLIGKLLSFLVSIFAVANGQGYLELAYVPETLAFFIVFSSAVVGFITGLYPSKRAKKTSALNALRYE
jgi:ABC-type lipoprotein release transport system permease subunit